MFKFNPALLCDFYKISHRKQYPKGTTLVYSNFTPRSNKYYNGKFPTVIFFGLKYFIKHVLIDIFNEEFFNQPKQNVINEYARVIKYCLGEENPDTSHIEYLHDLGYLPLKIKALPELSSVNYGTPVLTIVNTHSDFFWLTNFIETVMSSDLWMMSNNATIAAEYHSECQNYALKTCDDSEHVKFQCHDFSFRGMECHEAAIMSGMAHLTCFKGSDIIPAILAMEYYYNKNMEQELIGTSIPASEHSVMCAGGKADEESTYRRFITELYPKGFVSIVSDTWDFWAVLNNILPKLKNEIMSREGKVVIRPDSGDPVDIICGNSLTQKGAVEILWDLFGGFINSKGYKVLDKHIGLIYGDSITLDRAKEIFSKLELKGFASSNITFGVGSYSYQYNTRDSQGWAIKATYCEVNGKGREIFKEPKTDVNKKSAKGLLRVINGKLQDQCSWDEENTGELKTVFLNGKFV